jgi:hypothetical protein
VYLPLENAWSVKYLVEWAIAMHGMYESNQVCLLSIENDMETLGFSQGCPIVLVSEEFDILVKTLSPLYCKLHSPTNPDGVLIKS